MRTRRHGARRLFNKSSGSIALFIREDSPYIAIIPRTHARTERKVRAGPITRPATKAPHARAQARSDKSVARSRRSFCIHESREPSAFIAQTNQSDFYGLFINSWRAASRELFARVRHGRRTSESIKMTEYGVCV